MQRFHDRKDAGQRLAAALTGYRDAHPIVLALPRGGVPVADEVARALGAPLDVWVVRKVGVPWQPELGVGAVAEGDFVYLERANVAAVGLGKTQLEDVVELKRAEVRDRVARFRGSRPRPELSGRTVILVDDGIATGGTVRAAVRSIRAEGPSRIVLAVPVAAPQTVQELRAEVDDVVCLVEPPQMWAIGMWYEDFTQVSDDEVLHILAHAAARPA